MASRTKNKLRRKKAAVRKAPPTRPLQLESLETRVAPGSLLLSLPFGGLFSGEGWRGVDSTVHTSSGVERSERQQTGSIAPHGNSDALERWLRNLELSDLRQRTANGGVNGSNARAGLHSKQDAGKPTDNSRGSDLASNFSVQVGANLPDLFGASEHNDPPAEPILKSPPPQSSSGSGGGGGGGGGGSSSGGGGGGGGGGRGGIHFPSSQSSGQEGFPGGSAAASALNSTAPAAAPAAATAATNSTPPSAVQAPLTGDFNSDGSVDAADYTIWRSNFGATGATVAQGDATGDGIVDGGDFLLWQKNFGSKSGPASGSALPTILPITAIDDGDWGYRERGVWQSGTAGSGWQSDYRTIAAGAGNATASWVTQLEPAYYEVFATWDAQSDRSTSAEYTLLDGSTVVGSVVRNQQASPNDAEYGGRDWQSLGTYEFSTGVPTVRLAQSSAGSVVADGVAFVKINNTFDDNLTGWRVLEDGGTPTGHGGVDAINKVAVLGEGDSFRVSLEKTFVVPAGATGLSFRYDSLSFDTSDLDFINDAFEVALVDQTGASLVPTYAGNFTHDAFFNVSEDLPPALGQGVTVNGGLVTVSLANVAAGTQARLVFRLTNDDHDTNTNVRIVSVALPSGAAPVVESTSAKFFVVDAIADETFRYDGSGGVLGDFVVGPSAGNPLGVASAADGSVLWTVDGATQRVQVYGPDGTTLGSWRTAEISSPEGITVHGSDLWIVDRSSDRVYLFAGAAGRRDSEAAPTSSFPLATENGSPSDLVTNGSTIWVTDDAADKVFVYSIAGAELGSWALDAANADASGITLDPTGAVEDLWTVDRVDRKVYRYANAMGRVSGSQNATDTFALVAGNISPEGIADPPPDSIPIEVKWQRGNFASDASNAFNVAPNSNNVMMTPVVVDLDGDGISEIIFSTFVPAEGASGHGAPGILRAVRGDTGAEVWSATSAVLEAYAGLAAGDIDLDGRPEIIASNQSGQMLAFESDGTLKWISDAIPGGVGAGSASIANLDGVGAPEIIVGATVLNSDGAILWSGASGQGISAGGALSIVADVTMDGAPEIVAGRTIYRADGSILQEFNAPDGFAALGNFDNDAFPEVVLVASGGVYLFNHDNPSPVWQTAISGGGVGGAPTIADIDGDGVPDITVAGASRYVAFSADGSVKWSVATQDASSNVTGSSVFDLDGDGTAEVLYGDETAFRIYRGADGHELAKLIRGSGTTLEMPVVADANGDGTAEIVVIANDYGFGDAAGVIVLTSGGEPWSNTRPIWNQHSYHITNVNDDGTIPAVELNSWELYNNYRRNQQVTGTAIFPPTITAVAPSASQVVGSTILLTGRGVANGTLPTGAANRIVSVEVNGHAVDALDVDGNFFAAVDVQLGENRFVFTAYDAAGQSASTEVTVLGAQSSTNVDLSRYADMTGSFSGVYGRTSFRDGSDTLHVDLATRNDGTFATDVPLLVGIKNITNPSVRVLGADGVTPDGIPYFDFSRYVSNGSLAPGESTGSPTIAFDNPDRRRFDYELVFYGRINEAPIITSVPRIEALVGRNYLYAPTASDPDGDAVSFRLISSPAGMAIDAVTGVITWTPTDSQLGNHDVTIEAADGRGGSAQQHFVLTTINAPPNRPPVIVSRPTTDAFSVSGTYRPEGSSSTNPNGLWSWGWKPSGELAAADINTFDFPVDSSGLSGWLSTDPDSGVANITFNLTAAPISLPTIGTFEPGVVALHPGNDGQSAVLRFVAPESGYYSIRATYSMIDTGDTVGHVVTKDGELFAAAAATSPEYFTTTPVLLSAGDFVDFVLDGGFTDGSTRVDVTVSRGAAYLYDVDAFDPDYDTLTYSLAAKPDGMTINSQTGLISWAPTADQVGNHSVKVDVTDGRGGTVSQEYIVCVMADPANHAPIITSEPVTTLFAAPQLPLDLRSWQVVDIANTLGGDNVDIASEWNVEGSGFSVRQASNSSATVLLSELATDSRVIKGSLRVETTGDDDFVGFVFGYRDPQHFYVFDWKQGTQDYQGANAQQGMSVKMVSADSPLEVADLWNTAGSVGRVTSLYHNTIPWEVNTDYEFQLTSQAGRYAIEVRQGTTVLATIEVAANDFSDGRFGFYNYSQDNVLYQGFTQQGLATYQYDVGAIDPDNDALTYSLTQSPPGMTIDPATGLITWTPDAPAAIVSIDPRATYLHTLSDGALDSVPIDLAAMGLKGGDLIRLRRLGDYSNLSSPPDEATAMTGVFSSTAELQSPELLNRVPGALGARAAVTTIPTFSGGESTDILEDFTISDATTDSVTLRVPFGAKYLFVAAGDSRWGDNSDADGNFAVEIKNLFNQSTVAFETDFSAGSPTELSGVTSVESVQGYEGLGSSANHFSGNFLRNTAGDDPAESTTLTLTTLPEHTSIDLDFLLAIIDSWDQPGDAPAQGDIWNVAIDGKTIFSTNFENSGGGVFQEYVPPNGAQLGTPARTARGFAAGSFWDDAGYDMSFEPSFHNIPHSADSLTIEWFASGHGWEGGDNESWAIDNIRVALNGPASVPVTVRVEDGRGGFDEQSFTIDLTQGEGEIRGNVYRDGNPSTPSDPADGPILLLTPSGNADAAGSALLTGGFEVIVGALAPNAIAGALVARPDIDQIWIWNDGVGPLRNSVVAPDPTLAFTLTDLEALNAFQQSHGQWIMDGLAWRTNVTESETNLTMNEAVALAAAGGGIVLGADNGPPSGVSNVITQHVNQVAEYFGFELFTGAYLTLPAVQFEGGVFFDAPHPVDADQLTSSTTSYSELPHGLQDNGVFLSTAVFGSPSTVYPGFSASSPELTDDTFGGFTYHHVNHVVTTSIFGGGFDREGLAGWTIYLDQNNNGRLDTGEQSTITDANGNYAFTGLPTGTYIVREEPQQGWRQTYPSGDPTGNTSFTLNFEDLPSGTLVRDQYLSQGVRISGSGSFSGLAFSEGDYGTLNYGNSPTRVVDIGARNEPTTISFVDPLNPDSPLGVESVSLLLGDGDTDLETFTVTFFDEAGGVLRGPVEYTTDATGVRVDASQIDLGAPIGSIELRLLPGSASGVTFDDMVFRRSIDSSAGGHRVVLSSGLVRSGIDFGNVQSGSGANTNPFFTTTPPSAATYGNLLRYDAVAADPEHDPLTYALVSGPSGMTLNPQTGTLVWQPQANQLGEHTVVLRADDGRGGVALQQFVLTVNAPNTAPVFTSSPALQAVVNRPYVYDIAVQDAEGDRVILTATTAAVGALIATAVVGPGGEPLQTKYRFEWTPTAADLAAGSRSITLFANDGRGGLTEQTFTIQVLAADANSAPVITSTPRTVAYPDGAYAYAVIAHDANGDRLTYSLAEKPNGMTITGDGVIRWTPTGSAVGSHSVRVVVSDSFGGEAVQEFSLRVATANENTPPQITSNPPLHAQHDNPYLYNPVATDAQGDPLVWSLDAAPLGMSIDAQTGAIRWTPREDQLGPQNVTLRAIDPYGAWAVQSFVIEVACANSPPLIVSTPPTQAAVGELYSYGVRAVDSDGDAVTLSLASGPAAMSISSTGLIRWTPTAADEGQTRTVVVRADDGQGGVAFQEFRIEVTAASSLNRPPLIRSTPVFAATLGEPYEYLSMATDADGDTLTYSLTAKPAWLSIDPLTGRLFGTPTAAGVETVVLQVSDGTAVATQGFAISVRANVAPVINSTAPTAVAAGAIYRYDVRATDANGDPLTYSLSPGAPTGMSIDGVGRIRWTAPVTNVPTSPLSVTVTVTDPRGLSATQTFSIAVNADTVAPTVRLVTSATQADSQGRLVLDLDGQSLFNVQATDNVGVVSRTLTIDGVPVVLDANGVATYAFAHSGIIDAVATATDAAGNIGTALLELRVRNPNDTDAPQLAITSPDASRADNVVTYLTTVTGSVQDSDLVGWRLDYALVSAVDLNDLTAPDPGWVQISGGTTSVVDAALGVFDPTLLMNDQYVIRLYAEDASGLINTRGVLVSVDGQAKLGNFRLEFTDLAIPLAGIPIAITRVYDTLQAGQQQDFGYGWSLGIMDADIRETIPDNGGDFFSQFPFKDGTRVYLTGPDGKRIGFTFQPELKGSFFGVLAKPHFVPDPGVYAELEDADVSDFSLQRRDDGTYGGLFGIGNYNPSNYVLTTKDGTRYQFGEDSGLQKVTDVSGNYLTVTSDAIVHVSGQKIDLHRDGQGRIVEIVDPSGNSLKYSYDAAGNLVRFTNQADLPTTYSYLTTPAHFLETVTDSLGKVVLQAEFDAAGRLKSTTDALGGKASQNFDPANFTGTITDANGNVTELLYNDRGNVLRREDPEGGVTLYEYTDPLNPDLETKITNARGFSTSFTYDARGNTLTTTDAAGTTTFSYDARNNLTSQIDALGHATYYVYNAQNKVTELVNTLGDKLTAAYDAAGRQISLTDFNGNTTQFLFNAPDCGCANPKEIINPDGTRRTMQYNQFGQVIHLTDEEGREFFTEYDEIGRVTREYTLEPGEVRYVYDGPNLVERIVVDPASSANNLATTYEYDDAGRVLSETNPEGGVVEYRYDAAGNRVFLKDPVGNVTTWVYDANNRVIEERDPFYWVGRTDDYILAHLNAPSGGSTATDTPAAHVTLYGYDSEGNQTEIIDRIGQRRTFEFDAVNRLTHEKWWDGTTNVRAIDSVYDAVGNLLEISDPDSHYRYTYDALNRVLTDDNLGTPNMPRVVLTSQYDKNGNRILLTDNTGVTVESAYNDRNLLASRKWYDAVVPAGETPDVEDARIDFTYDGSGRQEAVFRYSDLAATNRVGRSDYLYDLAGRTKSIDHFGALDAVIADYEYDYDFAGRLAHESHHGYAVDYSYDRTSQLTGADYSAGAPLPDEFYNYDSNGNRTSSYLHASYSTGTANQLLSDGEFNYQYDGNGSLIRKTEIATGNVTTYEYDFRNRLVHVEERTSGGIIVNDVAFVYDAFDRRIGQFTNGETLWTAYNGDNAWADSLTSTNDTVATYYLFGDGVDDNLGRYDVATMVSWYLADKLGTIHDILMVNGMSAYRYDLTSFGDVVTTDVTVSPNRYLLTGREILPELDLYYFRSRYYSSSSGRFTTQDDPSFLDGTNPYAYTNNSPSNSTDPFGHASIAESVGIVALVTLPIAAVLLQAQQTTFVSVDSSQLGLKSYTTSNRGGLGGLVGLLFAETYNQLAHATRTVTVTAAEYLFYQERTPNTHPGEFKPVKGRPAKENKDTGEVWDKDKSGHRGPHWEVYKNIRDYSKGIRDRAVDTLGKVIKYY